MSQPNPPSSVLPSSSAPPPGHPEIGLGAQDIAYDAPFIPARILAVGLMVGTLTLTSYALKLYQSGLFYSFDGWMQLVMAATQGWSAWRMWFGTRHFLRISLLVLGTALVYMWGNVWVMLDGLSAHDQMHWIGLSVSRLPMLYIGAYLWFSCLRATQFCLVSAAGVAVIFAALRPSDAGALGGPIDQMMVEAILAHLVTIALLHGLGLALQRMRYRRMRLDWLTNEASADPLTGLLNRRALVLRLEAMLQGRAVASQESGSGHAQSPQLGALILLELDQFKALSDQHGFFLADRVLVQFARLLRLHQPEGCAAGRWGHETFMLSCPGWNLEQAEKLAERIRRAMESADWQGLPHAVTASFGVGAALAHDDVRALLRRVDVARGAVRVAGGNGVRRGAGEEGLRASGGSSLEATMARIQPHAIARLFQVGLARMQDLWNGPLLARQLTGAVDVSYAVIGRDARDARNSTATACSALAAEGGAAGAGAMAGAGSAAGMPSAGFSPARDPTTATAPVETALLSLQWMRVLFGAGAVVAIARVLMQGAAHGSELLSQALLVMLAATLAVLAFGARLPMPGRQVLGSACAVLFALHEVLALSITLSGTVYAGDQVALMGLQNNWLPAMYVAIFLVFPLRGAIALSMSAYFGVMVVGALFAVPPTSPELSRAYELLNLLTQEHFSTQIILVVLGVVQISSARRELTVLPLMDAVRTDALTGLLTRAAVVRTLSNQMASGAETTDRPLLLLLLDLDGFRHVNSTQGYVTGDAVLVRMAQLLREQLRAADVPARWSGEEFLVVAQPCTLEQGEQIARRMVRAMRETEWPGGVALRASIGVAPAVPGDTLETLLERVDDGLHEAKRRGGGRMEVRTELSVPAGPQFTPVRGR